MVFLTSPAKYLRMYIFYHYIVNRFLFDSIEVF